MRRCYNILRRNTLSSNNANSIKHHISLSNHNHKHQHHQTRSISHSNPLNMRIPYAPSTPTNPTPQNTAIYSRIAARRHPRPLIPLDLALLHNPLIADGYNSLLSALRTSTSLPPSLSEISICYIGVLNSAVYEWTAHSKLAVQAGVSRDQLKAILSRDIENKDIWSEQETAVLKFTEQSTERVKVEDDVFEKVKRHFDDQQIVELTMVVAGYNMVSRFLVALDVTESNGKEMVLPEEATA